MLMRIWMGNFDVSRGTFAAERVVLAIVEADIQSIEWEYERTSGWLEPNSCS